MKRSLLYLLFGACMLLTARAAEPDLPKVTHYGLDARFLLKENRVSVRAALTIRNITQTSHQEIPLLLYRLLTVRSVTDAFGTPLQFAQDIVTLSDEPSLQVNAIVITLSASLSPDDTVKVIIGYEGFIYGYPEVMAYVRERIDESYSLLRPDAFAYPMLARSSFSSVHAAYDSKFTYDISATVPQGYTAVCGGQLDAISSPHPDSTDFLFRSKVPTWRIDLAVAPFSVLSDSVNKLSVYHLPEDSGGARRVLEASHRVIGFYSGLFGPPPRYQGYTVIEIPDGWGSQASDLYFLQTAAAFKDSASIPEVYHEIGHTWNAKPSPSVKRCRYFDEAFASYFASLAIRSLNGEESFERDMERNRALFVQRAERDREVLETPIARYGDHELGRHSYTKGAWSLFVLDRLVGSDVFARIIRTMMTEYGSRTIDFGAFQALCERVSHKRLEKYFQEWIYGSASSRLLVDGVSIADIVKRY